MSSFQHMADQLDRCKPRTGARFFVIEQARQPGKTTTARIRQLLQNHGPMTAREIGEAVDLPAVALVGALLKNDLATGRVIREGSAPIRYAWNYELDDAAVQQLAVALRLVRRAGYHVTKKPN